MANTLKYAALDKAAGINWNTVYTCPALKTAIVKSAIAANDLSIASSTSAYLGVRSAGVVTQLTGQITVASSAAVNLLAGTLVLEAGDELVTKGSNGSRWKFGVSFPGSGTFNRAEVNGTTIIALTSTGIYRTTDLVTWTQVDPGDYSVALCAYISTTWFVYTSATAARKSTDGGLTWSAQAVTNAPYSVAASKMGCGIVKNGSTYAGLADTTTTLVTTTDGITWTLATAFPQTVNNLLWTGTNYVASRGSTAASIYYSTNGAAWTTVTPTGVATYVYAGGLATNGSGVVIALGNSASSPSRSTDHGATWSSLVTGGPTHAANMPVIWTGSVFATVDSNGWYVSTSGAAYTWGIVSLDNTSNWTTGFIYGSKVYKYLSGSIKESIDLALTATAGLAVTASIMEVS